MVDDLQISECRDFGLATVMLRKGGDAAAIGAALAMTAPTGPGCFTGHGRTLIGTGPGAWLVFAPQGSPSFAADLAARLPGASVSDQSDGYVILRIAGAAARSLLQRGAFIDLDPSAFGVGSAATTVMAHIGVVIWQSDDPMTFYVATFRSLAESFREWLTSASLALNV